MLEVRVFLSSPGDVAEERALAQLVFERLAKEYAGVVTLDLILWEHEPLFGHTGFQEQIDRSSKCDLVVSILWTRLGTRLPADFVVGAHGKPPTGTQFEIEDALEAFRHSGRPKLLIYRKTARPQIDIASPDAEERLRQFRDLEAFCRETFYDRNGSVLVAHHPFNDGFDFERRLQEHVRKWLEGQLGADVVATRWVHGSPFRGLQSFLEEHQDVFFGRSQSVSELIHRLDDVESRAASSAPNPRVLLIQGMSGSGKTSLVRAGLLPLLARRPIEGIAQWLTVVLQPSSVDAEQAQAGALGALARRVLAVLPAAARVGADPVRLAAELRTHPETAAARIETYLATEAVARGAPAERVRLVIFIDQLEEVFSALAAAEGTSFLAALTALAQLTNVWVIATIRSDFSHRLEAYPPLVELIRRVGPYTLLPPRGDELAEMIREPAAAAGLKFESRDGISLDREILKDAVDNPESLPLLEYALEQLYEKRDGVTLRWDVYRPADGSGGGLRGGLVAIADQVVNDAAGQTDEPFRKVMRELTALSEEGVATRRYAPLERFPSGSAERQLVTRMIEQRLCVADRRGDQPVVYIAHEALLQSWPKAQEWLKLEAALLRRRDELQREAHVWSQHGRSDDFLGTSPEKLATISEVEDAGLLSDPDSRDYALRSRSRARRNRHLRQGVVSGICALAVVSLIAGTIAVIQRNRARSEAATADRVSHFMTSLFEQADPNTNQGNKITVREVLDRGAQEVNSGLARDPAVRARVLTAMGEAYSGLGLFPQAIDLLEKARADIRAGNVPPADTVKTLLVAGTAYARADNDEKAAEALNAAVKIARSKLDLSDPLRSAALTQLAEVLTAQGSYEAAMALCNEALPFDRERAATDPLTLADTLSTQANIYYAQKNYPEAEKLFKESLDLRQAARGRKDVRTADALENLGASIYEQGRYAEAIPIQKEALQLDQQVYGPNHPEVGVAMNDLARSALMLGCEAEAKPFFERAVQMEESLHAKDSTELVAPLNSLGMIALAAGDVRGASTVLARAESIARKNHHRLLEQVLINVADTDLALGDTTAAADKLKEAHALLVSHYPSDASGAQPEAWRFAVWDSVNARLLAASGNSAAAVTTLNAAERALIARFGPVGWYSQRAQRELATLTGQQAASASPEPVLCKTMVFDTISSANRSSGATTGSSRKITVEFLYTDASGDRARASETQSE
jgi:tetratricopeptide (TPR) repeat protein